MTIIMTIITATMGFWRREMLFRRGRESGSWGDQTKGPTRETDYGSGRTLNIEKEPQHPQRHMLILSRGKSSLRLQGICKFGL